MPYVSGGHVLGPGFRLHKTGNNSDLNKMEPGERLRHGLLGYVSGPYTRPDEPFSK